ncbi:DNA polymerase-3 subunit gamma/tau [Hydrogenispora ethanolica]|uniref:DNA-directed DNA polymerase n=1 Tax=Hydrogenispora ethanolica TaxID=1082276 RepID=A0A4R1QN21_HYDET|nr:DNA polymerase III subunit gamma/tau [Hydrogenispora ethanolica]TCL55139.1 DNA polymerase-3 subunit gamma/tau [Hydrogenispora ethanolica]
MEYQTLYRRWRPGTFEDVVGQQHVVTTLYHAIEKGRVAHAYLFTGPRGTGKTSIAKIFAKALNCLEPQGAEACDHCANCSRISEGTFLDVIEIDAASNRGIDEIRDLREKVRFAPAEGKYKIYIIDEVHMLTTEAFNALLKTLEEPPQFVVFILATTEIHKIPVTILSRCQRFDFKRFTVAEIKGRLSRILTAEGVTEWSDRGLELIAEHAEGGMRDALGLLEQVLAHGQGRLAEETVRAILGLTSEEAVAALAAAISSHNTGGALAVLSRVNQEGKDIYQFGRSLVGHFRDLLLAEVSGAGDGSGSAADLLRAIEVLADATYEVKRSQQSSLPLELALIKLTAPGLDYAGLEQRLARLERLLDGQAVPLAAAPQPPALAPAISGPKEASVSSQPELHRPQSPVPAPESTPPQTAPPATAGSGAKFDWNEFLEAVKKKKRTLAALIQEGKPLQWDEEQLIVGLPPNLKFHLENLSLAQNRELLESILHEVTGKQVRISCVPATEGTPEAKAGRSAPAAPAAPSVPEPLAKAMAIFGGEVKPITSPKEEKE